QALEADGRSQVRKNCVASPTSLFICRCTALRPRALRPQLKRGPLGGVQEGIWPTVRFHRSYSPLYQGLHAPPLTRCPGRSRPPRPFSTTTSRFLPTLISAPSISPQAPFLRSRARGPGRRRRLRGRRSLSC